MNDLPAPIVLVMLGGMATFALIAGAFTFLVILPWLRAFLQGTPVALVNIVAMRLRGSPPNLLIDAYATLKRAGDVATMADVEKTYLDHRQRILSSDDLVEQFKRTRTAD